MPRGAWWATIHGVAEFDMTEWLSTHIPLFSSVSLHFPFEKAYFCLLFSGTLHSDEYIFLSCLSFLFFLQLLVKPPGATTLPSCISFFLGMVLVTASNTMFWASIHSSLVIITLSYSCFYGCLLLVLCSVQFSRSVASDSSRPHESHHSRPPCPSPTLEFTQTHAHRVGDAIQPSHPLSSPSPPAPNLSQHQGLFQWVNSSHEVPEYWSFSFSISPFSEHAGLISFKMDWLDLLAVQGTLKSLL